MIIGWTGRLGTGKTYSMVRALHQELMKGTKVYSNFRLYWEGYNEPRSRYKDFLVKHGFHKYKDYPKENLQYWSSVEEWEPLTDGIIAIDEGGVYLSSRRWRKMSEEFERKILQSRKDGLHIYFTSQRLGAIDLTLRSLVNKYYECTSRVVFGRLLFMNFEYDINDEGKRPEKRTIYSRESFWFNKKIGNFYDTNEKVYSTLPAASPLTTEFLTATK